MLGPTMAARKIANISPGKASQASVTAHDHLVDPAAEIPRRRENESMAARDSRASPLLVPLQIRCCRTTEKSRTDD
jgi:hypothetical protein